MNRHEWVLFFLQMSLMLTMALLGGYIMRKLRQPSVLGELLGGIIVGPTIFGMVAPGAYVWLFSDQPAINSAREAVITLGMLFFLFSAGLEVDLTRLNGRVWAIFLTSILGVLIPFGLGYGAVMALPDLWGTPLQGQRFILPIFIGTALSISALPVIARILMDLDLLDKEFRKRSDHLSSDQRLDRMVALCGHLERIGNRQFGQSYMEGFRFGNDGHLFGLGVEPLAGPSIFALDTKNFLLDRRFHQLIAAWVFAAAAVTEQLGLHPVLGAFQVGVMLGQGLDVKKNHPAYEVIQQFAVSFFAPLYFVSVGLRANFVKDFDLTLVLVVLFIASLGKVAGAGLGAWLGGMPTREALAVGSGLNARGAIEIILASVALEYRVIDQRIFIALVIMALATSMLSGPLMQKLIQNNES